MRDFTAARGRDEPDQLWLVEHDPVFTQGVAGRDAHVLAAGSIPVLRTERGGQVTYHGPGQVVAYPLLDLRRRGYYVKELVFRIEQAVLDTLAAFGVTGHRLRGAPGIYVRLADPFGHAALSLQVAPQVAPQIAAPVTAPVTTTPRFDGLGKIAALGVKVSNHCVYHGVALNVAMDLEPFSRIDPCGYAGLVTTDLARLGVQASWDEAARRLAADLVRRLD
jgi:lipoyl(octanoyl) transferase